MLISDCAPVLKKYGIKKAYLFGSVQENRARRGSDLDLYVQPLDNKHYWRFQLELEEILGLTVDLHTDKDDPLLVKKILGRGEKIYEI